MDAFLLDKIFLEFAGDAFQQTTWIPMGTNCGHFLSDIILYSHEADFVQSLLSMGEKQSAYRLYCP